ncbi:Schlafen and ATP-dependent DNA helicase domains-containing protein [Desulfonema limicola]|uniref:Schlafen and ATP-dependent DNA helicase domains-containing protein n=1 Tax=Desulfonema limicola TaxID=45656 RepID=A0A975GIB3_9BACT|nr:helix-turn-helix domain-containing protein [Desulfonema limicola]QTA82154.1 Schlafen and ATP-dependent DNA helicase domains-containing protein [Desulfonema limicola]
MTLYIEELLKRTEGKTLEFKRNLSSAANIMKTLVAFANSAGGILVIGVEDKTKVVIGVENPLDEEERLCSIIADSIEPRLVPNVELTAWHDKTLLSVEVFPSGLRPHWMKNQGESSGVYVRLGSTNRQADRELVAELKRSAEGIAFDELPLPQFSSDNIDVKAAQKLFVENRQLDEEALLTLKILTREQGRLVPTIGGVLLFGGKAREMHFPDAWVQCGRFLGKDKADIFDHTEIIDHLPVAVERVMEFLKKHAMRGADLSGIRRRDVWSIPLGILREVVINAVVHADYSQIGAPIRVAFFDDRIEIENPGILFPGLTIEDICRGVSKLRNRVIARVFREIGLIEQWGSGIPRIFKEAEESDLPAPEIKEIGMRLRFIVFLAESHVLKKAEKQIPEQVTEQVSEQVKRLLFCLKGQRLKGREIMDGLGFKHRPTFLYDYLQPALQKGLVEMTQPESPKSPVQKYYLSEKGKAFLMTKGMNNAK